MDVAVQDRLGPEIAHDALKCGRVREAAQGRGDPGQGRVMDEHDSRQALRPRFAQQFSERFNLRLAERVLDSDVVVEARAAYRASLARAVNQTEPTRSLSLLREALGKHGAAQVLGDKGTLENLPGWCHSRVSAPLP